MTLLEFWMQGSSAKALGWTLIHSLWEGAAVALVLAVVLGIAKSARVRYWAASAALAFLLAGFGATLYRTMPREVVTAPKAPIPSASALPPDDAPIRVIATPWEWSDLLPWLAPLWMAGVLLFQLRCIAAWIAAGRLRRTGVFDAPDAWMERVDVLRARLRMTKPVKLLESCFLEVPVVIGHLRPVILMPVGLLTGLPVAQIESILLHELAHIRRADYLVNLMQKLVEGLLFYHPAVWWISSVMRAERENCCDDVAVSASGDAHEYATALAALAETRWAVSETALAANGGNLVRRIRRVLAQPEGPRAAMAPALSAGVLIVTCAVALAAWQTPQQKPQATPAPSPQAAAEAQTANPERVADALERLRELTQKLKAKRSQSMILAQNDPAHTPYRAWLNEEVPYIITDAERRAFRSLRTDDERNMFIRQFWARRDPAYPKSTEEYPVVAKGNPENDFKKEHYRRIKYADDRFTGKIPGWKTDRGRIYIVYGPPDEIESHPSGGKYTRPAEEGGGTVDTLPFEQWRYRLIEGIGQNIIMEFVDTTGSGEYRLTMNPHEKVVPEAKQEEARVGGRLPMKVGVSYVTAGSVVLDAVFPSAGTGEKAVVIVGADKKIRATLPIDYDATRLKVKLTSAGVGSVGTPQSEEITGSYNLTAAVTDSSTWAEKHYVVNFSVN